MNKEEQNESLIHQQNNSLEAMSDNLQVMLQKSIDDQRALSEDLLKRQSTQSVLPSFNNIPTMSNISSIQQIPSQPAFTPEFPATVVPEFLVSPVADFSITTPASPAPAPLEVIDYPPFIPNPSNPEPEFPVETTQETPANDIAPPLPKTTIYAPIIPIQKENIEEQSTQEKKDSDWDIDWNGTFENQDSNEQNNTEHEDKNDGVPGWVITVIMIVAFILIRSCTD